MFYIFFFFFDLHSFFSVALSTRSFIFAWAASRASLWAFCIVSARSFEEILVWNFGFPAGGASSSFGRTSFSILPMGVTTTRTPRTVASPVRDWISEIREGRRASDEGLIDEASFPNNGLDSKEFIEVKTFEKVKN